MLDFRYYTKGAGIHLVPCCWAPPVKLDCEGFFCNVEFCMLFLSGDELSK